MIIANEGAQLRAYHPLDPTDSISSMRYFPRISQNSLKIPPNIRAYLQSQSVSTD